jgi:predicted HTH domain antitoxin
MTIQLELPDALLLRGDSAESLARRSRFLLAAKFFELGDISSGQAAIMCGLNRIEFLAETARLGVPAADLDSAELANELRNA